MHIYHYRRPYQRNLHLKQGLFAFREGLLLEKEGFWGEVAPFPGLNQENLDDCLKDVLAGQFDRWPSVAWAKHMLSHPLNVDTLHDLPVNALLTGGESKQLLKCAHQYHQEGYRCFKLKLGLRKRHEDLNVIKHLLDTLPGIRLRLDANRSWDLETALGWLDVLPPMGIEYLEEPLQNPADYPALWALTDCKIALDESLAGPQWDALIPQASALVLKPAVLGPSRLQHCLQQADRYGIPCVISSVFESGLSLRYLALLAQSLDQHQIAVGLDTWRAFSNDLCRPAFVVQEGIINFSSSIFTQQPQVRLEWLRQLT